MTINSIDELDFQPVENETPLHCNVCSKPVGPGGFCADVVLTDDSHFSFPVCSGDCLERFKKHPKSLDYINDNIAKVIS